MANVGKISIADATLEAELDDVGQCQSCQNVALEGEKHCIYCKTYWDDCANGMWSEYD